MRLTVLTFNTLGTPFFAPAIGKRYRKIAELINETDADVVCFQEVFSHYNRYWFDKYMRSYPYHVYKTFVLGVYGGLAIYSKLPIELQEYRIYTYPKDLFVPVYTSLARSGILIGKFKDVPLTLATTHLSSDVVHNLTPQNKFYKLIRLQLEQAVEVMNTLSQKGNTLMVGDFNISNDSSLYEDFLEKTKAQDLFAGDMRPSYAPDRIPYIYPAKTTERIDFMFYKGKTKVKQEKSELLFSDKVTFKNGTTHYLSDHIALKITIDI